MIYEIQCTPDQLDDVKNHIDFSHFTINKGKAKYHIIYIAKNSCGIYYALRVTPEGLCCKRAMEPNTQINVFSK